MANTICVTKSQLESLKQISNLILDERYQNLFAGEDGGRLDEELQSDLEEIINSVKNNIKRRK